VGLNPREVRGRTRTGRARGLLSGRKSSPPYHPPVRRRVRLVPIRSALVRRGPNRVTGSEGLRPCRGRSAPVRDGWPGARPSCCATRLGANVLTVFVGVALQQAPGLDLASRAPATTLRAETDMPGSVVAATPVEAGAAAETVHMNGHCSTDGADSKAAATRPEGAGCDAAPAGENGKHGAYCGDQKPGGHASAKANGHASGCPAEAWQREEAAATASEDGNESDRGTGTRSHGAGGDGVPDDKGATPETTPAGSDRAGGSPSCQTSEAHPKDDASSEPAANTHIHSLADSSSAETSAPANVDAPAHNVSDAATSEKKAEGGKGDVAITPTPPPDRWPSGDGEKPDDRPATGTDKAAWKRSESDLSSVDTPLSSVSSASAAVDNKGMHATAAPTAAAHSKPCKDDEDDEQLVASLIAVAHNTVHENGDAAMADADRAGTAVRAFALSDVITSSSSKSGQAPSAADKVIMATLLGLANRQKSEDATGSENGDDDDDDASGQGSSSRPDAGSDNDDMDEDLKAGKDSKSKGPGKRGPKKKRDKEGADGKTEGDDKDDDAENDAEGSDATKSARKAKKEADGDEAKPRGRKGKKQVGPFPLVVLPLQYATDVQVSRVFPDAVRCLMGICSSAV